MEYTWLRLGKKESTNDAWIWWGRFRYGVWLDIYGGVLGAIIYLVYSLLKRSNDGCGKTDSALDILHRRYASGEISKVEFERVKKDLQI